MDEYVSKETLQEKLNRKKAGPANKRYTEGWNDAILMVKSMIHCEKAADVAPVRHGRWITTSGEVFPGSSQFLCYSHKHEECGFQYVDMDENEYDYCPNCGAIMGGYKL